MEKVGVKKQPNRVRLHDLVKQVSDFFSPKVFGEEEVKGDKDERWEEGRKEGSF